MTNSEESSAATDTKRRFLSKEYWIRMWSKFVGLLVAIGKLFVKLCQKAWNLVGNIPNLFMDADVGHARWASFALLLTFYTLVSGRVLGFWEVSDGQVYVLLLLSLLVWYWLLSSTLEKSVLKETLAEESLVDGIVVEAETVEPRLTIDNNIYPVNYEDKISHLKNEIDRVQKLRNADDDEQNTCTEYQVLSLNQMLVDFLNPDDLIARSLSVLEDLEEYAVDDAYGGYDRKHFGRWEERVKQAITKIRKVEDDADYEYRNPTKSQLRKIQLQRDESAEELRATLRTLLEHVATYEESWAHGSTILRKLMFFCVIAIPTFLLIGILPSCRPEPESLSFVNWAFLGVAGSFTAVLLALRKSNTVEVGNTDGKKEVWRTVQGGALGLVAGILVYSMIAGDLISGNIVPSVTETTVKGFALSALWAVGAGAWFETVFERARVSTVG